MQALSMDASVKATQQVSSIGIPLRVSVAWSIPVLVSPIAYRLDLVPPGA